MRIQVPTYHFDADPDPTYHFDADPDPAPIQSDAILRPLFYTDPPAAPFSILSLPHLHCEHPRPIKAPLTVIYPVFPFCCGSKTV
jgi:hypothetical protein